MMPDVRDMFAAAALQGLLASTADLSFTGDDESLKGLDVHEDGEPIFGPPSVHDERVIAFWAWEQADAMMEQRGSSAMKAADDTKEDLIQQFRFLISDCKRHIVADSPTAGANIIAELLAALDKLELLAALDKTR